MPKPNDGESREDFISRCMGDEEANRNFPDQDQRAAFCNAQWDKSADVMLPKHAILDTEVKAAEEPRTLNFVVSSSKIDRSNDSINPDGWSLEAYRKNPVVLWSHSAEIPVGRAVDIGVFGGKLRSKTEFLPADNPAFGKLADGLYQMYKGGFLSATSVGFLPLDYSYAEEPGRKGGINFAKQELMEYSLVSVPANSEALIEGKAALGNDVVRPVFDAMVAQVAKFAAVEAILELHKSLSRDDLKALADLLIEVTEDEPKPIEDPNWRAKREYENRKRQRRLKAILLRGK